MAKSRYDVKNGTLELEWGFNWKNLDVRFNGTSVGQCADIKSTPGGFHAALPNGQNLQLNFVKTAFNPELQIFLDGEPMKGAANDPAMRVKLAAGIAFFVGGLTATVSIIALATGGFLAQAGFGLGSLFFAAVYVALGFWIRKGSVVAIYCAVALFGLDGIATLVSGIGASGTPPIGMIFVRVMLLVQMARAIPAARALALRKATVPDGARAGATGAPVGVAVVDHTDSQR